MASYTPLCSPTCSSNSGSTGSISNCVVLGKVHAALQKFGLRAFRPGQLESVLPALHGHDVFVKMATGAGKSLCMFHVPLAYSATATAIIISPLNSLMNEQVNYIVLLLIDVVGSYYPVYM